MPAIPRPRACSDSHLQFYHASADGQAAPAFRLDLGRLASTHLAFIHWPLHFFPAIFRWAGLHTSDLHTSLRLFLGWPAFIHLVFTLVSGLDLGRPTFTHLAFTRLWPSHKLLAISRLAGLHLTPSLPTTRPPDHLGPKQEEKITKQAVKTLPASKEEKGPPIGLRHRMTPPKISQPSVYLLCPDYPCLGLIQAGWWPAGAGCL